MPPTDRPASSGIFISYRRDDADYPARMIYEKLSERFGPDRIFFDVDNIPPGDDFVKVIDRELQSCAVFIAVIGERWLMSTDRTGTRRLDSPKDFVRVEIATALKREDLRIIPVLVQRAGMPGADDLPEDLKDLSTRNAIEISHVRFAADIGRLTNAVDRALVSTRRRREMDQHLTRARHAAGSGDFQAVIAACDDVLYLDPEEPHALELLEEARTKVEATREQYARVRIALDQASKRLAEGDFDEALRHVDEALVLSPELREGIELRAKADAARQERLRDIAERRRAQQDERLRVQQEQQRRQSAARLAADESKRVAEEQAAAEAAARATEDRERKEREDRRARDEAARAAKARADAERLATAGHRPSLAQMAAEEQQRRESAALLAAEEAKRVAARGVAEVSTTTKPVASSNTKTEAAPAARGGEWTELIPHIVALAIVITVSYFAFPFYGSAVDTVYDKSLEWLAPSFAGLLPLALVALIIFLSLIFWGLTTFALMMLAELLGFSDRPSA